MSILIKGATLPDSCWDCQPDFAYQIGCELWQDYEEFCERRHPNCPLVEIPTPHGRLVCVNDLKAEMRFYESKYCGEQGYITEDDIDETPTIIESED